MEQGPPKVALLTKAAVKPRTCRMLVDGDDLDRFETFYEVTTAGGTKPFLFPDRPPADPVPAMFGEATPTATNVGGVWWSVSFSLWIMP